MLRGSNSYTCLEGCVDKELLGAPLVGARGLVGPLRRSLSDIRGKDGKLTPSGSIGGSGSFVKTGVVRVSVPIIGFSARVCAGARMKRLLSDLWSSGQGSQFPGKGFPFPRGHALLLVPCGFRIIGQSSAISIAGLGGTCLVGLARLSGGVEGAYKEFYSTLYSIKPEGSKRAIHSTPLLDLDSQRGGSRHYSTLLLDPLLDPLTRPRATYSTRLADLSKRFRILLIPHSTRHLSIQIRKEEASA
ncbi:hypothetical protein ISN45_At04g006630 [Arabidopsis thaliana x Arabidopsis arenosa]|uniref:Uncharacterized protein n=1 Tax=Arabidopsis thaliana x Arabidopsis arenosa TaxID=1240361 RepID=A0A8T2DT32_9BRAS|nr:hypothetical protein ISN45_At04g006630 [Arabidopsis thaliana x Arabidopsis arenosa]